jgi:hypothetical protein
MNHPFPEAPENNFRVILKIFRDTRKSKCTTGIKDTGGKFCHRYYHWQIATCTNDTGGKFATGQ